MKAGVGTQQLAGDDLLGNFVSFKLGWALEQSIY